MGGCGADAFELEERLAQLWTANALDEERDGQRLRSADAARDRPPDGVLGVTQGVGPRADAREEGGDGVEVLGRRGVASRRAAQRRSQANRRSEQRDQGDERADQDRRDERTRHDQPPVASAGEMSVRRLVEGDVAAAAPLRREPPRQARVLALADPPVAERIRVGHEHQETLSKTLAFDMRL